MWTLLLLFSIGLVVGLFFKKASNLGAVLHKITFITVCVLLFFLGYLLGSNQKLLSRLPLLGLKSLALGAGTAMGSILATWFIFHRKAVSKK